MTDVQEKAFRYEVTKIGEGLVRRFLDEKITDMECLAACRKLKSVYNLLNRLSEP